MGRTTQTLLMLILAVVATFCAAGWVRSLMVKPEPEPTAQVQDVLRVRRLEVVDSKGRPHVIISAGLADASLSMRSGDADAPMAVVGVDPLSASMTVYTQSNSQRLEATR